MRLLLFIISFLSLQAYRGQQLPVLSSGNSTNMTYNPAFTGSKPYLVSGLLHRSQWAGFDLAPSTQMAFIHSSIDKSASSVGGIFINDRNGILGRQSASINYSYKLYLGESDLHFGLAAKYNSNRILTERVIVNSQNDAQLFQGKIKDSKFNSDFGILLNHEVFYLGISAVNLLSNNFELNSLSYQSQRHYSVQYGLNFFVGQNNLLSVSAKHVQTNNLPIWHEFDALLDIDEIIYIGAGYRWEDAVKLRTGISILEDFKIFYSYDFGINRLRSNHGGSHEILLQYNFHYAPTFSKDKARYNKNYSGKKFSLKWKRKAKTKKNENDPTDENSEDSSE